jgi:hypothetical protein
MQQRLSHEMLRQIEQIVWDARLDRKPIPVYAEADRIRRLSPELNIALEDIVEQFIVTGQNQGVAFEIDPAQARDAVMGSDHT